LDNINQDAGAYKELIHPQHFFPFIDNVKACYNHQIFIASPENIRPITINMHERIADRYDIE
jgi:hypothetical protein